MSTKTEAWSSLLTAYASMCRHDIEVDADELMHYHSYAHVDAEPRRVPPIYIYAYTDGRRFVQHNICNI